MILLAPAAGQAHDDDCLTVCARLARHFGAEGRVLPAAPDPAYAVVNYDWYGASFLDPALLAQIEEARRQAVNVLKLGAHRAAGEAGIAFGRNEPGQPSL